jgi:hypothetical protein
VHIFRTDDEAEALIDFTRGVKVAHDMDDMIDSPGHASF